MRTALLLAFAAVVTFVGCSGDKGQNQGQCGRYVDYYNQLPCAQDRQIDFLETCPDELADLQCPDDITSYYQCLIDGTICVGESLDTAATGNCKFVCRPVSPTPSPTASPRPTASASPTPSPSASPSATPSATPSASASPTATPSATPTPTATPSATPTPTATP